MAIPGRLSTATPAGRMALLYRFSRLNDRSNTGVFTFIATRSVTRDLHRDATTKDFPFGYHRWAVSFVRTDKARPPTCSSFFRVCVCKEKETKISTPRKQRRTLRLRIIDYAIRLTSKHEPHASDKLVGCVGDTWWRSDCAN